MFAALVIAAILSAPPDNGSGGGTLDADGLKALEQHDYARAEAIFTQLAAQDPQDYSALFNLAFAESALHKDEDATRHLTRVLELKPRLPEAEMNLAMLYLRDQKASDATPLLRDLTTQKPDNERAHRYLGDALLETGDLPAAQSEFETALKSNSKDAAAELGLGRALLRQGKLDDADAHYRAAAAADPALRSYLLELGQAYAQAHRPKEAIAILQQFPDTPGAHEQLGKLYLDAGDADAAAKEFSAAVQQSPTTANKLALATAYLKGNHPELAEPLLAESLQSNPRDFDVLTAIGKIEMSRKNYPVAAKVFLAAAQVKPDSAETWSNAAACLMLGGQNEAALGAMDRARALRPETPGDLYFRAVLLDRLHQTKQALATYQQFLAQSDGKYPDQEFLARHRSIALKKELGQ